jgi:hypothetical protein
MPPELVTQVLRAFQEHLAELQIAGTPAQRRQLRTLVERLAVQLAQTRCEHRERLVLPLNWLDVGGFCLRCGYLLPPATGNPGDPC